MRPFALLSALALCTCLTACKLHPNERPHALRGTVDSVNALTIQEVAKLGVEEAKKRYLGKVVTFKGLDPLGVGAKNENRENVCMQDFGKWFKPEVGPFEHGGISVFFNFGEEITEWDHKGEYRPEDLKVENLLQLDEDVCDTARVCNEGDAQSDRKCLFSSARFLISGKVISVGTNGSGKSFGMDLRPTGLRY